MRIRPIRSFVWHSRTTRQRNGTLHARYIYGDMYLNVFSSGTFDFFRRLTRTYSAEEQSQKSCILWYV